jgi:hypothetical protein
MSFRAQILIVCGSTNHHSRISCRYHQQKVENNERTQIHLGGLPWLTTLELYAALKLEAGSDDDDEATALYRRAPKL